MSPRRLVMLARAPAFGQAKTRLAADVGPGAACRMARAMLSDCWAAANAAANAAPHATSTATCAVHLAVCDPPELYPLLTPAPTRVVPQGEGDLGARMGRLTLAAAREGDDVLLLGTDAPGLTGERLLGALDALATHDLVLGPVPDGGFWCLGLSRRAADRLDEAWLDGLDWEQDGTAAPVRARAASLGLTLTEAEPWFDVDRGPDLEALAERLQRHPASAPASVAALASVPRAAPACLAPSSASPASSSPASASATSSSPASVTAASASPVGAAAPPTDLEHPALISVIVASLDEGAALDQCLEALARQPGPVELIVSDGGSRDRGPERAAAAGHLVLRGPPGRGRQLAAGAAHASGQALLFLHVDTRLPDDALSEVRRTLAGGAEAGAFVTHTARDPSLPNPWGPLLRLADLRSRFTRHPYGDQAMFCTRAAYDAVGGLRSLPIMEDYDLSVRLAARRPLARIASPVRVSGRRMQARPLRTLVLMRIIPPLYRLGVAPARLARLYRGR